MKHITNDQNYLKFAKFFIMILIVLLIISSGKIQYWPFTYWDLYDQGNPKIPEEVSRIELRVIDVDGKVYSLPNNELYTLDDDSSVQPAGKRMIDKVFMERTKNTTAYRIYLIKYLEKKLNLNISAIEAYKVSWYLNYNHYPPFDINSPSQMVKIGSFQASNYTN